MEPLYGLLNRQKGLFLEKFIPDQSTNHAFIFGNEVYGVNQKSS